MGGTARRLGLLGTLYFCQGLPFGFFVQALPVVLRKMGVGLPAIGAASLLAVPWMVKFLWAPWVDQTRPGALGLGRRRAWILPLQLGSALAIGGIAALDPAQGLWVVMAATLVTNLFAATQDVAADGLAVELLRPDERGLGNGVQVAAYRVGMIVGGGALLWVYDREGWTVTLGTMAALLVVATVPIALHREAPRADEQAPKASLWEALARPGMLPWLGTLALFKLGEATGSGMLRPMLVDLGVSTEEIATMVGVGGFTAGLIGAALGGVLVGRLGLRAAVGAFGALQSLAIASWIPAALGHGGPAVLYGATLFEHLASGLATVSVFTAMMSACRRDAGLSGTDYTLQASAFVIATGLGGALSGVSAQALGYDGNLGLAAVLSLLGALVLALTLPASLARLSEAPPRA